MSTRAEEQIAKLKRDGFTVIGSYERNEGGTQVVVACPTCNFPRTPEIACPYCTVKQAERKRAELRTALEQLQANTSAALLLIKP